MNREEESALIIVAGFIFAGFALRYSGALAGALMLAGLIYGVYRYQAPSSDEVERDRRRQTDMARVVMYRHRECEAIYGNQRAATQAWLSEGLMPEEAANWMDAGCYYAGLAVYLADHGLTPELVGPPIGEMGPDWIEKALMPEAQKASADPGNATISHEKAVELLGGEVMARCNKRKPPARKRKRETTEQAEGNAQ